MNDGVNLWRHLSLDSHGLLTERNDYSLSSVAFLNSAGWSASCITLRRRRTLGFPANMKGNEMPKRKIILTQTDFERLEALLSSEFTQAIGPLEYLDGLADELQRAVVVPPETVPINVVTMNSTVKLRDCDTNELDSYTLVFPEQADIANGKLSVLAPVGTAILGQRVGDSLRWRTPGGWRRVKVERVLYQPERTGVFSA